MKEQAPAARKAAPGKLSRRVSPPPAAPDAAGLFDRVATIPGPAEPQPGAARNRISALSLVVYPVGKELSPLKSQPAAEELAGTQNLPPMAEESRCPFHSTLSWSHYGALLSVEKPELTSTTVLEYLGIPRSPRLQESTLEQAIMDHIHHPDHKVPGDNPTIGLIRCSENNETIARYSVLHEYQQLFASKYRLHLPSEEELAAELKREIHIIGVRRSE